VSGNNVFDYNNVSIKNSFGLIQPGES